MDRTRLAAGGVVAVDRIASAIGLAIGGTPPVVHLTAAAKLRSGP